MNSLPVLTTKELRFRNTRRVFVIHPLAPVDEGVDVLKLWEKEIEEKKRRRQPLAREQFYRWHKEEAIRQKHLCRLRSDAINNDLALGRMWYWVCSVYPFGRAEQSVPFEFGSTERNIAEECLEWIWSAERSALVHFYLGEYRAVECEKIKRIRGCSKLSSDERMKIMIAAVAQPYMMRTLIQRHIASRNGKMFSADLLESPTPITSAALRIGLFAQINEFQSDLNKRVLPQYALSSRSQRSLEILLTHECSKAAYAAIQAYLSSLKQYENVIEVDAELDRNRIIFPIERIKLDLKAPILEASHQERVRFANEAVDEWAAICGEIIDDFLNVEDMYRRQEITPFMALIIDEAIAEDAPEKYLIDRVSDARDLLLRIPRCPEAGEVQRLWDEGQVEDAICKLIALFDRMHYLSEAPILEASHQERVRFANEAVDEWAAICGEIIDDFLNVEDMYRRQEITPFMALIIDEAIAEDASEKYLIDRVSDARDLLLRIPRCPEAGEVQRLWDEGQVEDAICKLIALFDRMHYLSEPFEEYRKLNGYKPMYANGHRNGSSFLAPFNMDIPDHWDWRDHGYVTEVKNQVVTLDTEEHELIAKVASMRKALPRQLSDYGFFFKKRLPSFVQFVNNRQKALLAKVSESVEYLKLLQTFANPADVDEYVEHMRSIVPVVENLCAEVEALNAFERVVDMPQTEVLRIRGMMRDVTALSKLFTSTQRFHQLQKYVQHLCDYLRDSGYQQSHFSEFFSRRRIDADVDASRKLVDEHIAEISSLETLLATQRAAKHFILQARNEADKFKKNFAVLEIMTYPRFMEKHWLRMSEIVGYDLSRYKEASVAQICELELDVFISQLKAIAFDAEQEAAVTDQLIAISTFWQEAAFSMEICSFWKIGLPDNLEWLIKSAKMNMRTLRAAREPENAAFTASGDKIINWVDQLEFVLSILLDWHKCLTHWKRLAGVMRYSSGEMPTEFAEFRKCAKYWKKFAEKVSVDPLVINIYRWEHIRCWLRIIDRHINKMIDAIRCYLNKLRRSSARICFLSDADLLKLLSEIHLAKCIRILKRACFPGFRDISEIRDGMLALSNFDGETLIVPFEIEKVRRSGALQIVNKLQSEIDNKLCEEVYMLVKGANKSEVNACKLTTLLDSFITRDNVDSPFRYIIQNGKVLMLRRGEKNAVPLTLAFITVESIRTLSIEFADNWSLGKFPLVIGNLRECRRFVRSLSQTLFTTAHYVNCNARLQTSVISEAVKASVHETIVIALENIDQLSKKCIEMLLEQIASTKTKPFPRLVLLSTSDEQRLAKLSKIFVHKLASTPDSTKPARSATMSPFLLEVSVQSLEPGSRRVSTRRRESSLCDSTCSELAFTAIRLGGCACVGELAKRTLTKGVELIQAEARWIFLDAFSCEQLISEPAEFGTAVRGYLPLSLKETIKADERASFTTLSPLTTATADSHRLGSTSMPQRYIIFYTHQQFTRHFSILSALFCAIGHDRYPPPYITLPDGCNFYAADNMHFLLCLPSKQPNAMDWLDRYGIRIVTLDELPSQPAGQKWDLWKSRFDELLGDKDFIEMMNNTMEMIILPLLEAFTDIAEDLDIIFEIIFQDLKELRPNMFAANYGELIRWASCSACCNWLAVFVDKHDQLDFFVTELVAEADKTVNNAGRLPSQISLWKLSALDFSRWVRWMDEPNVVSCLEKDLCLSDIVVMYPDFDRVITYIQRLFTQSNNNILLYGPDYCGKTTVIKRFVKHMTSLDDAYRFIWLQSGERFDLLKMQKRFSSMIRSKGVPYTFVTDYDLYQRVMENFFFDYERVDTVKRSLNLSLTRYSMVHVQRVMRVCRQSSEHMALVGRPGSGRSQCVKLATFALNGQQLSRLILTQRIAKGVMFAFPDNTPDLDGMIRLWAHEVMRCVADSFTRSRHVKSFFEILEASLKENFSLGDQALSQLLNGRKKEKGNEKNETLFIYPDVSSHVHFERSWRSVMSRAVQLATTTNRPITVVIRLDFCQGELLPEWVEMLKQWLQQPVASEMVTDETILSASERIVEHEKMLATAMQTSSIRLPGQRSCRFVPLETLRNSAALEKILSARIADLVHVFFLVGPDALRYLQFCTIDCYLLLSVRERNEMCMRILAETELPSLRRIQVFDVLVDLNKIFTVHDRETSGNRRSMISPESRIYFLLCRTFVKVYSHQNNFISKRTVLLQQALQTIAKIRELGSIDKDIEVGALVRELEEVEMNLLALKREYDFKIKTLEQPTKDLRTKEKELAEVKRQCDDLQQRIDIAVSDLRTKEKELAEVKRQCDDLQQRIDIAVSKWRSDYEIANKKLRAYTSVQYRKLGSIKKPTIGVRLAVEAVRCLFDPAFRPQRNSLDTWVNSQELLRSLYFQSALASFDVDQVGMDIVQRLKKYLENREFRPAKVETESSLAASMCDWTNAVTNLVTANTSVERERGELKQVMLQMQTLEEEVSLQRDTIIGTNTLITQIAEKISAGEQQLMTNKRNLENIQRSRQIISAITTDEIKWQEEANASAGLIEYLLGDSILMAAFSVLLGGKSKHFRKVVVPLWKEKLTKERIVFTEEFCRPISFILHFLRNVDVTERWPLLIDSTGMAVETLCQLYPTCTSVDVDANMWHSEYTIKQVENTIRSGTPLIIHSIRCSPPTDWYPLISVDVEREFETVHFYGRNLSITPNAKLFFVTSEPLRTFSMQFVHMTSTFVIDEMFDRRQRNQTADHFSNNQRVTNMHLVELLNEHTAEEVLRSEHIVEQIRTACSISIPM
ncbi:Dynein heavy chain, cytoplasmic [Toxocara canis]|uniref:Dynein heavy chain, cytoplasmic n=1 Tax=Toxocara canis TaxID=6265 RepID=A0A0B2VA04_TOXCA|nr:Dynein heavy chain, cytoplasmic [Toxocara canis]